MKDNTLNDVFFLDLKTYQWTQVKMTGQIPTYLGYNYSEKFDDNNIIVFWCDRNNDDYSFKVAKFNIQSNNWQVIDQNSKKPEFRYGSAFLKDQT